jgi:hypothetical protein
MTDLTPPTERGATVVDPTTNGASASDAELAAEIPIALDVELPVERGAERRARFRASIAELSARSTSDDLVRWMLVPGSILVFLGFVVMLLGWVGASRTAREIEQIPYLISGGLVGLALVVLGGLLLASTFWVAVLRKLHTEAEARAQQPDEVAALRARLAELETTTAPARAKRSPRTTTARRDRVPD